MPVEMFDGFQDVRDDQSRRRVAVSTATALLVLGAVGAALLALGGHRETAQKKAPVEVVFRAPPPPAEPPPAPPPPPEPKPEPRPAARSRPASSANTGTAPPVPTAIPDAALAQGDPSRFRSLGSVADLSSTPLALGGGPPPPPPPPPPPAERRGRRAPSVHIENVSPPRAKPGNDEPAYPEAARRSGLEGLVVLELRIDADGSISDVDVVSGDEPFIAAAIAAVRSWSYEPARVDGVPTATHRLVRVPFRLRG